MAEQAAEPHSFSCRPGSVQPPLPLAFTLQASSAASAKTLQQSPSGRTLSRSKSQHSECSESSTSSSSAPGDTSSQPKTPQNQVYVESPSRKRRSMRTRRHRRLSAPSLLGLDGSAGSDGSDKLPSAGVMRRLQEAMIPATLKQLATKQRLRYNNDADGLSIAESRAAVGARAREYQETRVSGSACGNAECS
eukprot:TRINITY_DN25030_c0_g1_i1.p1 TRINITY_DN25030_c0_g1~~TRINITY_DN25030_c0_g1_i1.p1  ORF type:complete len:192 (-),score=31.46 TRINITY_DN25030_c0_g1_i1:162-737(-)